MARIALTALLLLLARSAAAGPLEGDPLLTELEHQALAERPELQQALSLVQASRDRAAQAGALPDPTLSLSIQNDGFRQINIGVMENSFWQVGLSQTFPWFGKRGLRREVAELQAQQAQADVERVRLSTQAEVRRAYLGLLLARDQLRLLGRLEDLWRQSEGLARARYESAQGAQSDLLRAQLERSRLRQRRWAFEAEERRGVQALNRLRARSLAEPIETTATLASLSDPVLPDAAAAVDEALGRSPELAKAVLAGQQAEQSTALARRDYFPDFTLSAAIMPRGSLDPMWQAGVAFNLPIWAAAKQSRAVDEAQSRGQAAVQGAEALRQLLRLRVEDRLEQLRALLESNRLYRSGLLVQSEAAVTSTLAQYRVGRVTFASAMEALAGYLNDENGFLQSAAAAQQLAIAQDEVSLDPVGGGGGGLGGGSVPGAGAVARGGGGGGVGGAGDPSPAAPAGGTGSSMSRM
jgi:outer membrane protein, heavy metal efflux system